MWSLSESATRTNTEPNRGGLSSSAKPKRKKDTMNEQKMIADAAKDWNARGGEIGTPFGLVKLTVSVRYKKDYGCGTVFMSAVANSKDVFDTLGPRATSGAVAGEVELHAGWVADALAQGASMAEIGQLLRHRTSSATEIYAKVDFDGLRSLALPWPRSGGSR